MKKSLSLTTLLLAFIIVCAFASKANAQLLVQRNSSFVMDTLTSTYLEIGKFDIVVGSTEGILVTSLTITVKIEGTTRLPMNSIAVWDGNSTIINGYLFSQSDDLSVLYENSSFTRTYYFDNPFFISANTMHDFQFMADILPNPAGNLSISIVYVTGYGVNTFNQYITDQKPVLIVNAHAPGYVPSGNSLSFGKIIVAPEWRSAEIPIYANLVNNNINLTHFVIPYYGSLTGGQFNPHWTCGGSQWGQTDCNGQFTNTITFGQSPYCVGASEFGYMRLGLAGTNTGQSVPIGFSGASMGTSDNNTLYPSLYDGLIEVGPHIVPFDINLDGIFNDNDLTAYLYYIGQPSTDDSLTHLRRMLSANVSGSYYSNYGYGKGWSGYELYWGVSKRLKPNSTRFPIEDPLYCYGGGIGVPTPTPIGLVVQQIGNNSRVTLAANMVVTNSDLIVTIPAGDSIVLNNQLGFFKTVVKKSATEYLIVFAVGDSLTEGTVLFDVIGSTPNQITFSGTMNKNSPVEVSTVLGVGDQTSATPTEFALKQNYPNPFNPTTTISFALSEATFVTLKVYDVLGQEVVTLVNQQVEAGDHSATFDAAQLPSGLYIYKISAGNGKYNETKKMILMK